MLAILYCRKQPAEYLHGENREALITDVRRMLAGLSDAERKVWTLMIASKEAGTERVFGPKI